MDYINIHEMPISDLKAAHDFTLYLIKECEIAADNKKIPVNTIPVYTEHKVLENKLYDEILNRLLYLK